MTTRFFCYILLCVAVLAVYGQARPAFAQTYTESTLYSFCSQSGCPDGELPFAGVVQGTDGNFYGTTYGGGTGGNPYIVGTVFKITPSGALTTLYSFCTEANCTDGETPYAGLVEGMDGNFYGTTSGGGNSNGDAGDGTVFKVTPTGTLTTLYKFCSKTNCTDGESSTAGLVLGKDGNFYGVTPSGGNSNISGTFYKITPAGELTTLYSFCSKTNCTDGEYPYGGLVQGTDGNFYGTTELGGNSMSAGTVFKITPEGTLTTLYSFCTTVVSSICADGADPQTALVQGTDGNFYGATGGGGNSMNGGTLFKITPAGALTTIYTFCSLAKCADGADPYGSLTQAKDGNFYGTTVAGGVGGNNKGTAFKITSAGVLTTLYSFCSQANCADGAIPQSALIQGTDGNFYGTTVDGGLYNNEGTVFKITVGLPASTTTSTATPNPVTVGQIATLKATVSSTSGTPTGTVTFSVNGEKISSCTLASGACIIAASTNGFAPETYPIVATYAGSSSYAGSASSALDVVLNAAPTTTTLAVGTNPVTPPASDTLTATVKRSASGANGTPTGTVTFYAGTTVIGSSSLSGSGVAKLTASTNGVGPGTYPVTAKYNGDANDTASTSSPVSVVAQ